MGNISKSIVEKTMPSQLQQCYGSELGIEIYHVLGIVEKSDRAIAELLATLKKLDDRRRKELINHIWERYYDKVTESVLPKSQQTGGV